jgi:hypothetical protein
MKVRLTRRLAEQIDGVDLTHFGVGDVLDLPAHEAMLLLAEGWATRVTDEPLAVAADAPRRRPAPDE